MSRPSKVHPHQYVADVDEPADHRGFRPCGTCRLVGAQGDAHHPDAPPLSPARPLPAHLAAAAHDRDAAILGEKDDL